MRGAAPKVVTIISTADRSEMEGRQPHIRGGAHEPLSRADIEEKFALCCRHGGWDKPRIAAALKLARGLYAGRIDLAPLRANQSAANRE